MTKRQRKPAIFRADDPRVVVAPPSDLSPPPPDEAAGAPLPRSPLTVRRLHWGSLFWSALSGLIALALGVAVASLIESLLARSAWLGAVGIALAALAGVALAVMIAREVIELLRLGKVEDLRQRALGVLESDDRERGRALVADLLALTRPIPHLAHARARIERHRGEIIDGRDLVRLCERELMGPLDGEARRLVAGASKRVSVVTAVSPRAAVDVLFVLINALGLIRALAALYGGRPGTLGVLTLFRRVVSHLAVTGGVALSDSVLQQVIGHGLAARVSARLGEGMVNGLLTARLGLLTIDLVRPLPFRELPRPALNDLAGTLFRSPEAEAGPETAGRNPSKSP